MSVFTVYTKVFFEMVTVNSEKWRSPGITHSIYWILTRKSFINTSKYMITKLFWVLPELLKRKSCEDHQSSCPALLCKWRNFPYLFYGVSEGSKHQCCVHIYDCEGFGVSEESFLGLAVNCSLMGGREEMKWSIMLRTWTRTVQAPSLMVSKSSA